MITTMITCILNSSIYLVECWFCTCRGGIQSATQKALFMWCLLIFQLSFRIFNKKNFTSVSGGDRQTSNTETLKFHMDMQKLW